MSFRSSSVSAAVNLQEGPTYIVQPGDSLNGIALRFGISPDDIQSANNLDDPNALFIGQRLVIPGLEGISGILTTEIVPFGTSLKALSRQYTIESSDLVYLNRLTSPSETVAGLEFIIPIKEGQDFLIPLPRLSNGETLLDLAIQTEQSPWMLLEDNQMAANWELLPGDMLFRQMDLTSETDKLPNVTEMLIRNLPVIQGETLVTKITTDQPIDVSGMFDEVDLVFFNPTETDYVSFLGIHAMSDPGIYPLTVTVQQENYRPASFTQLVLILDGGYGFESVQIDDETYLDPDIIADEDASLQPIFSQITPERHWEGRFQPVVDDPCPTSAFGLRRDYNQGKLFFYHTGLDFRVCAPNLNIYAPAAGEVVLAEELFIKGKAVIIDHGWGIFSVYVHLREFNVGPGDFVQPGDLLGLIGNTGRSTGPHLHFEVRILETPVNPQTWLSQEFP